MKKYLSLLTRFLALGLLGVFSLSTLAMAQPLDEAVEATSNSYFRATVIEVLEDSTTTFTGEPTPYQELKIRLDSGEKKGQELIVDYGKSYSITEEQKVAVGDPIIVNDFFDGESNFYSLYDRDRLGSLFITFALFFALVVGLTRMRGIFSMTGLLVSIGVLVGYIIPHILAGDNPLVISLIGSLAITGVSLFLAHGFNKRTALALGSTLITLGLAAGLSLLFVDLANLSGAGAEEAFLLQLANTRELNLKGLLLGGIIIGTLGVLDDVTTAQTAAVYELKRANKNLGFRELYTRSLRIGREHIASLVNTLVLAYAGAALPLLLLFQLDPTTPFWVTLNSELIAEEVVRTLVGSSALVLGVPISSFLAALYYDKRKI
ncbi:YibE/F family protein [Candidatus Peregrinibacteria bacterium CG_4_9_14_0_2_um_filter_53_11]|nr:MAG: YibE/F family protein [Candidatus Peregrinibacteria bacterium CG_4_9_14_0_2_um_filter_53_11]